MKDKVKFSRHAIARFKERFSSLVEDNNPLLSLANKFYSAKVNKSFLNNTGYMAKLYDKYGTEDAYEFRVIDDIVFVIKGGTLVTLYGSDNTIFNNNTSRFRS